MELQKPFFLSSERIKKRYTSKARQCIDAIFETIAPSDSDMLFNASVTQARKKQCNFKIGVYKRRDPALQKTGSVNDSATDVP